MVRIPNPQYPLSAIPDNTNTNLILSILNKETVFTANDNSISANNGTPTAIKTWLSNGGAEFDSVDSRILYDSFVLAEDKFLFECLFIPSIVTGTRHIFRQFSGGFSFWLRIINGKADVLIGGVDGSYTRIQSTGDVAKDIQYHAVIVQKDGDLSLYLNNVLIATETVTSFNYSTTEVVNLIIGFESGEAFGGVIKFCDFYSSVPDNVSDYIDTRYKYLFPEQGVVLKTLFTDARDSSGNNNHGTSNSVIIGKGVNNSNEENGYCSYEQPSDIEGVAFTVKPLSGGTNDSFRRIIAGASPSDSFDIGCNVLLQKIQCFLGSSWVDTDDILDIDTYQRIVIVKNGANADIYKNGVYQEQLSGWFSNSGTVLNIGSKAGVEGLKGIDKQFIFFNDASVLTQEYILNDYEKHKVSW